MFVILKCQSFAGELASMLVINNNKLVNIESGFASKGADL